MQYSKSPRPYIGHAKLSQAVADLHRIKQAGAMPYFRDAVAAAWAEQNLGRRPTNHGDMYYHELVGDAARLLKVPKDVLTPIVKQILSPTWQTIVINTLREVASRLNETSSSQPASGLHDAAMNRAWRDASNRGRRPHA